METLKTYGAAWAQSENDTPCTPAILELENKLLALGFSPLRIGGRNHTHPMVDTLAIEMPNGHPLFINMQNSFANRQKGYIHFFCTMPANAKQGFICDAYDGSKFLSRANFILCAWLSNFLDNDDFWLKSGDYSDMRLFRGSK